MLELIKSQLEKKDKLNKQPFYQERETPLSLHFNTQMNIFAHEYYHELNPGFISKISKFEYFNRIGLMTARDGFALFASFIIEHYKSLKTTNTHFVIHKDLARMVPNDIQNQFSCWSIQQHKKINIEEASRIIISGIALEQFIPNLKVVLDHLQILKKARSDCPIEIFLPQRILQSSGHSKESTLGHELILAIGKVCPDSKISFLTTAQMLDKSDWRNVYFLDLVTDKLIMADNYFAHYAANRGATVSSFSGESNKDSIFELDLGLSHKIQFEEFPKAESVFPELIFYKKQYGVKDGLYDKDFHRFLRTLIS